MRKGDFSEHKVGKWRWWHLLEWMSLFLGPFGSIVWRKFYWHRQVVVDGGRFQSPSLCSPDSSRALREACLELNSVTAAWSHLTVACTSKDKGQTVHPNLRIAAGLDAVQRKEDFGHTHPFMCCAFALTLWCGREQARRPTPCVAELLTCGPAPGCWLWEPCGWRWDLEPHATPWVGIWLSLCIGLTFGKLFSFS